MSKHTCKKHPKYKGKRIPKRECPDCLLLYVVMHSKPRLPVPPPSFTLKDKSKYSRKKKHKSMELDN